MGPRRRLQRRDAAHRRPVPRIRPPRRPAPPRVFVAENVTGLVRGVSKGYFKLHPAHPPRPRVPRRGARPRFLPRRPAGAAARDLRRRPRRPRPGAGAPRPAPVPLHDPRRVPVDQPRPLRPHPEPRREGRHQRVRDGRLAPDFDVERDPIATITAAPKSGPICTGSRPTTTRSSASAEGPRRPLQRRRARPHVPGRRPRRHLRTASRRGPNRPTTTSAAPTSAPRSARHGAKPRSGSPTTATSTSSAPTPTRPAPRSPRSAAPPQACPTRSKPRRFTIAEVKRLSGFPDDYTLTGSFQQQWERLGDCVPPPMRHVAHTVRTRILEQVET